MMLAAARTLLRLPLTMVARPLVMMVPMRLLTSASERLGLAWRTALMAKSTLWMLLFLTTREKGLRFFIGRFLFFVRGEVFVPYGSWKLRESLALNYPCLKLS